jgi:2-polyprenyl-3-methyl-5-hydroxy-6-metoxy-1,4-benzoquinol methylase
MDQTRIEFDELLAYATHDREPFFSIARRHCFPNARILDIGAGDGTFARSLKGCEVHLLDGNPETVERLQAEFEHVHLQQIPGRFPFDDGYFNTIHCSHLIEHLQQEELYECLIEIDRCLAIGGTIVISAPLMWSGFYDDLSHVRPYTQNVLINYLTRSSPNRTRQIISDVYTVLELRYRYHLALLDYYNVSHVRRFPQRLLYYICNLLRRINFTRYERSGYTLVMRKGE